uniref:Ig-like domain-containing protein n=1 Tax=Cyprinodon variegatus TaxID=28743 RepID=A0A3Q2CDX8_CYPVA
MHNTDGPEEVLVKTSPSYGNVIEGSDILLSCSADSRPAASFEWFFNENQILNFGSELNIIHAGMNDEGEYSCRAFNNKTSRYQSSPPMYINVEDDLRLIIVMISQRGNYS